MTRRPFGSVRSTGVGSTAGGCAPIGGGAWRSAAGSSAATGPV